MKPEDLAQWYFRFNGFFTISNFVVHPTRRGSQLTDGDVVGVRFPYRVEFPNGPGADEEFFAGVSDRSYFVLAEVKRTICELNPSWRASGHRPVVELLRDLGPFPAWQIEEVVSDLFCTGIYAGNPYASLFFVGAKFAKHLPREAPRRTWSELVGFIFDRFAEYRRIKTDHEQWDPIGHELWSHFTTAHGKEPFVDRVKASCGLE